MKRILLALVIGFLLTNVSGYSQASHVVISEVYGGGNNSGAPYRNDFVELYNPTNSDIVMTNWSVQYSSGTGTSWSTNLTSFSGTIKSRGFFLIKLAGGTTNGVDLPGSDASGTTNMSATAGKVALCNSNTALPAMANPSSDAAVVDFVGYGSTANGYEGSGSTSAPSNTMSIERKANVSSTSSSMQANGADQFLGNGYDSNANNSDFVTRPPEPQNSSSMAEPDVIPPTFTSSYPQSASISSTGFDLVVNLSEAGKVYYVVLADGANAPSAMQVKAGQDDQGNAVANSGSISVLSSGTVYSGTILGLLSSTNYDVYVVAEDAVFNLQTSATMLDVTTNVAPSISPSVSILAFSGFTEESKQSSSLSYTVSASNLTADVTLSVSGNFLISNDNNSFTSSFKILAADFSTPQTVYVKFNPSNNVGAQTGVITHSSSGAADKTVSLSAIAIDPFNQNFNDPAFLTNSGWTEYSVAGAQMWSSTNFGHTCLTGCNNSTTDKAAQMNGYSGSPQNNEDWLISPQLDLTTFANFPSLSFATISAFAGDGLQLKYSADYTGNGDPALATWTLLNGKFPAPNSSVWTTSSTIILPKSKIYIAFVYSSNTTAASRWTLDDWKVEDVPSYIDLTPINFSFGEVVAGNSSPSQSFDMEANGYGDITISVQSGFELSVDNTLFSSSLTIVQAEASAGQRIYVRFTPPTKQLKWIGSVNLNGTGLSSSIGSLSGSSYPKSETLNIATYNMEFFGTDIRSASNVEFGPTNDALQVANVTTVMQSIAADIFAVEEISDDTALDQLVSNLSGYNKVVSNRWSYSWQAPDPNFPPQKIGFIYKLSRAKLVSSRVMFASMYDSILAGTKTLASYPTGTSSSFWSSGRLPFMATFDVTVGGVTRRIRVIDIHAKSASDQESYNRRVYDVKVLHDSLNMYYPHDNIILLGDFNDQVFGSILNGAASPYKIFIDDGANFKAVTYDLNVSGASTFPNSNSFIDNIVVSNELVNAYVANSVTVEDARSYIAAYINTTSDHLPVWSRFLLSSKADQTLTFDSLKSKTYGDAKFVLTATASSGLPASFASSDSSILSVSKNVATIVKAGTVTITAGQTGSEDFNAAAGIDQVLVINKADQTISFGPVSNKTEGDPPTDLVATTTSGLTVIFATTSDKISITGNQATIAGAGRVSVTASQSGNENYNTATSVDQSFCINPFKPSVTIIPEGTTLFSSAKTGNQWYLNGTAIPNATDFSLDATADGIYKVQVQADDCFSEFSEEAIVKITGLEKTAEKNVSIHPNPADDYIFISGAEGIPQISVTDLTGRKFMPRAERCNEGYRVDIRDFASSIYIITFTDGSSIQTFKFLKK